MPSFTHVLIMKSGRILTFGEKRKVLASALLSEAFDTKIALREVNARYRMTVKPKQNVVI